MKKSVTSILTIAILLFAATGCRVAPVYNVQEAAIVVATGKSMKLDDVTKAIVRAGGSLGWVMKVDKPGHIVGTLTLRTHVAEIDVNYDTKSYSITYRNSQNLNYDGTNIHSNYNGWIQRLQQNINVQLTLI